MPRDPILDALVEAVSTDYEVFGELGRREDQSIAFLAQRISTKALVALVLTLSREGDEDVYSLDVIEQLDARVPASHQQCQQCHLVLRPWARYCTRCGNDASGLASTESVGTDDLRRLAEEAAGEKYELLGEMPRAGGGGAVYFGRNRRTAQVAALRLELGTNERAIVSTTQTVIVPDPAEELLAVRRAHTRKVSRVSVVVNLADRVETVKPALPPPMPTLTGTEPTAALSRAQAAEVLGIDASSTQAEIRRRYEDMYSEYRVRESNAPTGTLRAKYLASLASIEAAGRALLVS